MSTADKNISKNEIKDLGELAHISVSTEEAKKLESNLEEILGFISNLKEVDVSHADDKELTVQNVFRKDESPHEANKFTKKILENAPSKKEGFIKVKKIL